MDDEGEILEPTEQIIEIVMMESGHQITDDGNQYTVVPVPWSSETNDRQVQIFSTEDSGAVPASEGRVHIFSAEDGGAVPTSEGRVQIFSAEDGGDVPTSEGRVQIFSTDDDGAVPASEGRVQFFSDDDGGAISVPVTERRVHFFSEDGTKIVCPVRLDHEYQIQVAPNENVTMVTHIHEDEQKQRNYDNVVKENQGPPSVTMVTNIPPSTFLHAQNSELIQRRNIEEGHEVKQNRYSTDGSKVKTQKISTIKKWYKKNSGHEQFFEEQIPGTTKKLYNKMAGPEQLRDETIPVTVNTDQHDLLKKPIVMFKWGSKDKRFRCQVCDMSFSSGESLKTHFEKHSYIQSTKPFPCCVCLKSFSNFASLQRHSKCHSGIPERRCKYCQKAFANKENLDKHVANHTDLISCPSCDEKFAYKSTLATHLLTHSTKQPYDCEECGKSFSRKDILGRHKLLHETDRGKKFRCVECGKSYTHMFVLRRHMRSIHSDEPDGKDCEICGKFIRNKENFKRHMKIHCEDREFPCSQCDYSFKQKQHLLDHMNTHSSELNYKCEHCDLAFKHKRSLNRHLNSHRKLHTSTLSQIQCEVCGKSYIDKITLNRHIKTEHTDVLRCNICTRIVPQAKMSKHVEYHEKNGQYSHRKNIGYKILASKATDTNDHVYADELLNETVTIIEATDSEGRVIEEILLAEKCDDDAGPIEVSVREITMASQLIKKMSNSCCHGDDGMNEVVSSSHGNRSELNISKTLQAHYAEKYNNKSLKRKLPAGFDQRDTVSNLTDNVHVLHYVSDSGDNRQQAENFETCEISSDSNIQFIQVSDVVNEEEIIVSEIECSENFPSEIETTIVTETNNVGEETSQCEEIGSENEPNGAHSNPKEENEPNERKENEHKILDQSTDETFVIQVPDEHFIQHETDRTLLIQTLIDYAERIKDSSKT